jgi:hypothetical protein
MGDSLQCCFCCTQRFTGLIRPVLVDVLTLRSQMPDPSEFVALEVIIPSRYFFENKRTQLII